MAKKKQVVYPVLFMIALTVFFVAILAVINSATKDIIDKQAALEVKQNILYVLDLDHAAGEEGIEDAYAAKIEEKQVDGITVYYAKEGDQTTGYAFPISGSGLWGSMDGFAAVNSELDELLGISFVSHSETPGLGGRVDEAWFKEQFRGLPIADDDIVIYRPSSGGNVDAITGATLTSQAARKIINDDVDDFINGIGGDL